MKPTFVSIKNFDKFQHYKHRNPPWIKLYYDLLDDDDFISMSIESRHHYMTLLLIAGHKNNRIPHDTAYLKKVMRLDEEPDLTELIERGFLLAPRKHAPSRLLAPCKQNALSEIETDSEAEGEAEAEAEERERLSHTRPTSWQGDLPVEMEMEFGGFWVQFPIKLNRQRARRAWFDARQLVSAQEIMDGLQRSLESAGWGRADNDGAVFDPPHAHRWLNDRRWEDQFDDDPAV